MNARHAFSSFVFLAPLLVASVSVTACGGKVESSTSGTSGTTGTSDTSSAGSSSGLSNGDATRATSFPLGRYSKCAWLVTGNTFEGEGLPASTFTLAASGDGAGITAIFDSAGEAESTLLLAPTSAHSATATKAGQAFAGKWGYCGAGATTETLPDGGTETLIADPAPSEATLSASAADVTLAGDSLFLTMTGPVIDSLGFPGCAPNQSPAAPITAVLECDASPSDNGSASATKLPSSTGAAGAPTLAPGTYNCSDSTDTVVTADGTEDHAGVGGAGTLTLTKSGSTFTAALAGDDAFGGTLTFDAVSGNAAIASDGQTVNVACGAFTIATPVSTANPAATNVEAGSLTTDGTTLTLIALGSVTGASCSGQTSSTVLTCTPKS